MTEQCSVCLEFVEDYGRDDIIFYDDQPFHRECFKEKADDEMPEEAAERVKELVDDPALTRFEKDGNLLIPWTKATEELNSAVKNERSDK